MSWIGRRSGFVEAVFLLQICLYVSQSAAKDLSLAVNTWAFTDATQKAWEVLASGASAVDAVEQVFSAFLPCQPLQLLISSEDARLYM